MGKEQTWEEYFAGKTDDQLKKEAEDISYSIDITECYGVHDLTRFERIRAELERRGWEAIQVIGFRKMEAVEV